MRPTLLTLVSVFCLSSCDSPPDSGPVEVRWDRETCVRCTMSVGDKRFAAQVRQDGVPYQAYLFDDIGCAIVWLGQQTEVDTSRFEVWVNNHRNGNWIDARQAWYVSGMQSPMGYNLAASSEPTEGALNFDAAIHHVMTVEATQNIHGGGDHVGPAGRVEK